MRLGHPLDVAENKLPTDLRAAAAALERIQDSGVSVVSLQPSTLTPFQSAFSATPAELRQRIDALKASIERFAPLWPGRPMGHQRLETLTVASGDRSNNAAFTRRVGNKIGERAGTIVFFTMTAAPLGYLKANSAAVRRTTYATLFAAIGTTFGAGNGSTTFKAARRPRRIHTRLGDVCLGNQASQNLLQRHRQHRERSQPLKAYVKKGLLPTRSGLPSL